MENQEFENRKTQISEFRSVCKQHGIKVTPQRIEIFLTVISSRDHPSAEDVFHAVRKQLPTISLDTVYRTLNTLAEYGLLAKVYIIHDRTRFDPNVTYHHHLVCTRCGKITDFEWHELDAVPLPSVVSSWGRPENKHLQVLGICSKCLENPEMASK